MKVKIYWFSPTDPEATDVAHYSQMIMPWLVNSCQVLNAQQFLPNGEPTQCALPVANAEPTPVNIYHLGNSKMHCQIYDRMLSSPGLVVLHEVNLVNLAQSHAEYHGDYSSWRDTLCSQYGEDVRDLAMKSDKWEEPSARVELAVNYPLFKPLLEAAVGVIVHSEYAERLVRSQMPADMPIKRLNLPYPFGTKPVERDYRTPILRFVFCGHVGENRRIAEFMQAWGMLSDPSRIRLDIYGHVSMQKELSEQADTCGVADFIKIHGFVEREVLIKALEDAHFGLNLRWPTMGETSSCNLLYWSHALPTIGSDVGWTADLPDEVIMKIPFEEEVKSLTSLLEEIITDPERYARYGRAGYDHLHKYHSYEDYVTGLLEFARDNADACNLALSKRKEEFGERMLQTQLADVLASMSEDYFTLDLFKPPIETACRLFQIDSHTE